MLWAETPTNPMLNIIDIEKSEDRELIIKTSSLDKKIEYVKEGFFLDILYQDTNP